MGSNRAEKALYNLLEFSTAYPKAHLPGRTRAQPRAVDEEMDEEGPVLDRTVSEEHDALDEEDAIEEGHAL